MINKKGLSMQSIFISAIVGIMLFASLFSFVKTNADIDNVNVPTEYIEDYNQLTDAQNEIDQITQNIKSNITATREAEAGEFVFNGIRGFLGVISLPIQIINVVINGANIGITALTSFIPNEVRVAIGIILLVLIVFSAIRLYSGRANDP
jgi:hypothetical protein